MKRLLLVEDQVSDARNAAQVAGSLGIDTVDASRTVQGAMTYLEQGLTGTGPLPDGIVLDLDLGLESGFELLRFWHQTPALSKIPVIVWSVVEEQKNVCDLFKVDSFVSKWEGLGAFRQALGRLVASSPSD